MAFRVCSQILSHGIQADATWNRSSDTGTLSVQHPPLHQRASMKLPPHPSPPPVGQWVLQQNWSGKEQDRGLNVPAWPWNPATRLWIQICSHLETDPGLGSAIPPAVSVTQWGLFGSELLRSNWDQGDFTLRWLTHWAHYHGSSHTWVVFCKVLAHCRAGGGGRNHRGGTWLSSFI